MDDRSVLGAHMEATYRGLRWWTALVGMAMPLVLWVGGALLWDLPLKPSMSSYYHTAMRDELVGMLLAEGALLVAYRGFSNLENRALDLAGLFLAGVALFPMKGGGEVHLALTLHGGLSLLFFLCIAYVCLFRASDTLSLMKDEARRRRYRTTYRWLGGLMIAAPLLAAALGHLLSADSRSSPVVFFVEAAGVYVFAAYWIVKSRELRSTHAEELAVRGRLVTPPHRARDLFKAAPVELVEEAQDVAEPEDASALRVNGPRIGRASGSVAG